VGSDLPEADVQAMLYEVDPTAAASAAAAGRTFCVYYDMFVQFWRDQLNQRYGKSGSSIFDKVSSDAPQHLLSTFVLFYQAVSVPCSDAIIVMQKVVMFAVCGV
jgi:hypothetical protein